MRSFVLALIAAGLLAMYPASTARADYPSYLILRTPTSHHTRHPSYGYYPGYQHTVRTQSYAYGWFGVRSRWHGERHFGYYNNYRQGTYR